jgi:hypothetical protein
LHAGVFGEEGGEAFQVGDEVLDVVDAEAAFDFDG